MKTSDCVYLNINISAVLLKQCCYITIFSC